MWREYWDTIREYANLALEHAGMWREYLALARAQLANWREFAPHAGPAIAIVNGLLVVAVALLPLKTTRAKVRIGLLALALALGAIGMTAYAQYTERAVQERIREARLETRAQLAAMVRTGTGLLAQISDPHQPLPVRQADQWAFESEALLKERFGPEFVTRFRTEAPLRPGESSALPPDRSGYWSAVRSRLIQLERILAEYQP